MMELRQLRYFTAVAETLNFSRAAETLYISQSALSQQIADLEREMGVQLLQRSKRSVELTPAGRAMLAEAKKLLHQSEKLVPYVRQIEQSDTQERELFIGVDFSMDLSYDADFRLALCDAVSALRTRTPSLRATFHMYEHPELARTIDVGTVDLGFFLCSEATLRGICRTRVKTRLLWEEEMVLVLRGEEPIEDTPDNVRAVLKERGLFLLEQETRGMSQALQILEAIGVQPHIRFNNSRSVMVLMAESGESTTLLPASLVRGLRDSNLQCLHFGVPAALCQFRAVWREENQNCLIPSLLDHLTQGLSQG